MQVPVPNTDELTASVTAPLLTESERCVKLTQQWLIDAQYADGSWVGELEGDTILESEYAMMLYFMHQTIGDKMQLLAEHLRRKQTPEGGWSMYPGGPVDLSASVKAYFTLKLCGDAVDAPHMARARQAVLELGGVAACNSFTKFYLCMFGQYEWSATPAIPPEIILLPTSAYFNIYAISSWSRAMVITMAIIWHFKPVVKVPAGRDIDELFVGGRNPRKMQMRFDNNPICWRNFFLTVDKALKLLEVNNARPLRAEALKRCKAWMLEHFEGSGGVAAIFPPMINSVISLRCFGYKDDHPLMKHAWAEVEALEIHENGTLRMQPCFSPVWDTSLAMVCLAATGMPATHPSMQKATRWLVDHEVRRRGDLHRYRPNIPIGGWYFEYANEYYPDADDTAMVLMALDSARLPGEEDSRRQAAIQRGVKWALAMQSKNGGWAAFDVDNDREIFTYIPFADHNAMLDPPTADITARALEAFGRFGYGLKDTPVDRAIKFLKEEQEHDGCWYGRWGVNYIYGTWQVLRGLEAIGANMAEPWIQAGAAWLRAHQNADGGWGESCASYEDPSLRGQGASTASQTAWALMGLMSAGDYESNEVINGLCYLISHQKADGTWDEELFTGTGFPRVFYLKYHYYRIYFPMYALGMYMRGVQRRRRVMTSHDHPRLVVIEGKQPAAPRTTGGRSR